MSCANCLTAVTNPSDRNSILKNTVLKHLKHEEYEHMTVIEALADMLGQHDTFEKILSDIDSEDDVPFLCPACFDVVCRNVDTRREFVFKCHRDGLINSVLSLVLNKEEPPDDVDVDVDGIDDLDDLEPNAVTPEDIFQSYKDKFELRYCKVVLTRCDEIKHELNWESDRADSEVLEMDVDFEQSETFEDNDLTGVKNAPFKTEIHTLDDDDDNPLHQEAAPNNEDSILQRHEVVKAQIDGHIGRWKCTFENCGQVFLIRETLRLHSLSHKETTQKHSGRRKQKQSEDEDEDEDTDTVELRKKKCSNERNRPEAHSHPQVQATFIESPLRVLRQKYKCLKCNKTFANTDRLESHAKEHEEEDESDLDELSDCSSVASSEELIESGQINSDYEEDGVDSDEDIYETDESDFTYDEKTIDPLVNQFACKIQNCDVIFDNEDAFRRHIHEYHMKDQIQTSFGLCLCHCGLMIGSISDLEEHTNSCTPVDAKFYEEVGKKQKCETCGEEFSFFAELLAHKTVSHNPDSIIKDGEVNVYKCDWNECDFKGDGINELTVHMFEHTLEDLTTLKCMFSNCGHSTGTVKSMIEHCITHMSEFSPSMSLQAIYASSPSSLQVPLAEKRSVERCGDIFRHKAALTLPHARRRSRNVSVTNKECGKVFSSQLQRTLDAHIAQKHDKTKQVRCPFENCGLIFNNKEALRKHKNHWHTREEMEEQNDFAKGERRVWDSVPIVCMKSDALGVKKMFCPECPKTFPFKTVLLHHLNEVHVRPSKKFQCPNCVFCGTSLKQFLNHLNFVEKEKLYKCTDCNDFSVCNFGRYQSHIKSKHGLERLDDNILRHHGYTEDNTSVEFPEDNCQRSLICRNAHCVFTCDTDEEWKCHEECGTKMFHCKAKNCNYVCLSKVSLSTHVQETHCTVMESDPDYDESEQSLCDWCGSIFSTMNELKQHMKFCASKTDCYLEKVEGTRTYRCEACREAFSFLAHLQAHKAVDHFEGDSAKYKCNRGKCTFQGTGKDDLTDHIFGHTKECWMKCKFPNCNYVTGMVKHWETHVEQHIRCEKIRMNRESKQMTCDSEKKHQCELCGEEFLKKVQLQAHRIAKHPDKHSGDAFKDKFKLCRRSRNNGTKRIFYQCNVCGCSFSEFETIHVHLLQECGPKSANNGKYELILSTSKIPCEKCADTFNFKTELLVHSWIAHETITPSDNENEKTSTAKVKDTVYNCRMCDYSSNGPDRKRMMVDHVFGVHTKEKRYKCKKPNCQYETGLLYSIKKHVKNPYHRTDTKPRSPRRNQKLQCTFCQKYYRGEEILEKHVSSKHNDRERPFKCSQCPFASAYNCSLKTHVKFMHKDEKTKMELFSCKLCSCTTVWKGSLVDHMKSVHGVDSIDYSKSVGNSRSKPIGSKSHAKSLCAKSRKTTSRGKQRRRAAETTEST